MIKKLQHDTVASGANITTTNNGSCYVNGKLLIILYAMTAQSMAGQYQQKRCIIFVHFQAVQQSKKNYSCYWILIM